MNKILSLILIVALSATSSFAMKLGHEGNGGDVVEGYFIERGTRLLAKLSRTSDGQRFLESLPVGLIALAETLDHTKVSVYNGKLGDRSGAEVDAIVEDGIIYLHRENWLQHMKDETASVGASSRDIERLIFHEMLRAAGVVDDNYIYSKFVSGFSDLIDPREAMSLSKYINPNEIQLKVSDFDTLVPVETHTYVNNMEMNLQISFSDLYERTTVRMDDEKTHLLNIPIYNTGLARIVIYRIDYEYEGMLKKGSLLISERATRFQSSTWIEHSSHEIPAKESQAITFADLVDIQSPYKESLQLKIRNRIQHQDKVTGGYMVLKRIVIYFNVLGL